MSLKILAIKFKYLGDIVVMVPALRALRAHYPEAELHVLVAEEAASLLEGLPWIQRVWALPRSRGKAHIVESLPVIRRLRAESFDQSVDFVGNDRGAFLSRLVGARRRLGVRPQCGYRTRRLCYTETIEELDTTRHETIRDAHVLSYWGVPPPKSWELELALIGSKTEISKSECSIVCHLSTSQRKKEWPMNHWVALGKRLTQQGFRLKASSGPSEREYALLKELGSLCPAFELMDKTESLKAFTQGIGSAHLFISPDTAPLHIAAGLGISTLGLFGPTSPERWAPPGNKHRVIRGSFCPCSGHWESCAQDQPCMSAIQPETVVEIVLTMMRDAS